MGFYIFDFDGTIANIDHRRHILDNKGGWDAFFEACDQDAPITEVINVMKILIAGGHRVEIWSGRSNQVEQKSRVWLRGQDLDDVLLLKRMRQAGDYTPDDKLKLGWLNEERALGNVPDVIFDDRQKVVDMWRANDVPCFQVNPGDFDAPKTVRPYGLYAEGGVPLLSVLIGPAGAGKTSVANDLFEPQSVISTDVLRRLLAGSEQAQDRNPAVFSALDLVVKARLLAGLPTVVDATNIRRADRVALLKLLPKDIKAAYIIVHRPLEEMLVTAGDRLKVLKKHGKDVVSLVHKHEAVFQSNLKDIKNGDGFDNVEVFLSPADYKAAVTQRADAYSAALALSAAQVVIGNTQGPVGS